MSGSRQRPLAALCLSAVGAIVLLAGCARAPEQDARSVQATETPAVPLPGATEIAASLLPLNRADLIAAVAAAADATANGQPLPVASSDLVGRRFDVRLPFGCGAVPDEGWAQWSFDPKTRVLKLTAQVERWGEEDWVRDLAGDLSFEAAEGFWIERPWSSAESCPADVVSSRPDDAPETGAETETETTETEANASSVPPPQVRQTVGLAQFFPADAPRTRQRGSRPYSIALKRPENAGNAPPAFRLRLTGRISGFADRQPVHCWNEAASLRPVCLISVEFLTVAFEDAATGAALAQWKS